jgi:hypothetical protein
MNYTIVDKNLLIPEIYYSIDFISILTHLYTKVYQRNVDYCSNIYIVKKNINIYESIIKSDGNNFYETFINGNTIKLDIDLSYNFISSSNNNQITFTTTFNPVPIKTENKLKPMELVINEKIEEKNEIIELPKPEPVETEEEKRIKEEKERKKELLLKTCEQVMDLYNLELSNIKRTENQIKTLDTKLEKLANKKRDKIMTDITRTKSEYETWKKIKYQIKTNDDETLKKPESELELRENPQIPILFTAKYNFIDNSIKNEKVKKIYEILNNLDLDKLFINDKIDLDNNVIKYCDKYYELSKKDLHYKFDHDWDYLESEMNVESKSGSSTSMFN